jgi:hypothetical protein
MVIKSLGMVANWFLRKIEFKMSEATTPSGMDDLLKLLADCLLLAVDDDTAQDGIYRGLIELRDQMLTSAFTPPKEPKPKPPPYSYREAPAYRAVIQRYGFDLSISALLSLACIFTQNRPNLHIDRASKRRKDLLYKWLDTYYDDFILFLPTAELFDPKGDTIES